MESGVQILVRFSLCSLLVFDLALWVWGPPDPGSRGMAAEEGAPHHTLIDINNTMNSSRLWLLASRGTDCAVKASTTKRCFGSGGGSRGARGHGWWVNYRAGKGGRHLQGEYHHLDVEALKTWNDAVFSLGSQRVYMDVAMEPFHRAQGTQADVDTSTENDSDGASVERHRLVLELATEVLPRATDNFKGLLQAENDGFKSSILHRIERSVGWMGGNVWKDTGKCLEEFRMQTSATSMAQEEHMVLSHVPGAVTMLCQRVGEIDSRFLLCAHHAPHLDGRALVIGRMDAASREKVLDWESSIITKDGRPTSVNLRIVDCGILEGGLIEDQTTSNQTKATAQSSS